MSHEAEIAQLSRQFHSATDRFTTLVGRGQFAQAAQMAGQAGQVAARLRSVTGSPDWAGDARTWQAQQRWAREQARGGA